MPAHVPVNTPVLDGTTQICLCESQTTHLSKGILSKAQPVGGTALLGPWFHGLRRSLVKRLDCQFSGHTCAGSM